jgi:NAD(P)-dependent dehydrogenase (short-subunit alcohol dehydrogenase family)
MSNSIKDKKIILMGVTGVLGRSFLDFFVKEHVKIVIADKPSADLNRLSKKYNVPKIEIDLSKEKDVINGIKKYKKIYKILDGAVFNSAITSEGLGKNNLPSLDFTSYPLKLWNKALQVNLTGAFLFSRECGKIFQQQNFGSLINISSIYGVVAPDHRIYQNQSFNTFPAYSASKFGLIGLTKWLSTLWAQNSIRVNCVSPGGVNNNHNKMFKKKYSVRVPMSRMANKNDVNGILLYLLSDDSSYCTGQNFVIDGGLSVW